MRRSRPSSRTGAKGVTRRTPGSELDEVLDGRDALLHEGVPFVAVGALPQQLRAAVTALHADVRVQVEHRVLGGPDIALHAGRVETELDEDVPDRLMDHQP